MLPTLHSFVRFSSGERRALKVQLLLVVGMCVLLSLGYYGQREWREFADDRHLQVILRGWDGFAWFVWVGAAPMMLWMIHRFPIARGELRRSLTGLLVGSLGLYLVVMNLRFFLRVLTVFVFPPASDIPLDFLTYLNTTLVLLPLDFLTYCVFFAISFAVEHYFRFRQHADEAVQLELKAAQLVSKLSQAEMAVLRNQLHPHFLFNSFNAIATLVRQKKNEVAVEVIARLSALLRRALDRTGHEAISLENEMDFIRHYLDIERVRFGEKLRVNFSIDPATLGALVPNMVLQPLVENAIKHGISRRITPGAVSIIIARNNDRVAIEIINDGPETPPVAAGDGTGSSRSIGLANTRLRLDKLYGVDYELSVVTRAEGGVVVMLNIPWQPAPKQMNASIS